MKTRLTVIAHILIAIGFVIWACKYILFLSFIGADGQRYYCLFDDAFVGMRYGWNLSHGNGLVWNPGEYVEGYTNFLTTISMAVATWLADRRPAVALVQVFCAIQILGTAFVSGLVARRLCAGILKPMNGVVQVLVLLATLLCAPLVKWSMFGMETALVSYFLMLGTLHSVKFIQSDKKLCCYLAGVFFGLAYLSRPDSLIPTTPAFALLLSYQVFPKFDKQRFLLVLKAGVVFSAFLIAHTLFRKFYYGSIVPNTYFAKVVGIPLSIRIANGYNLVVRDYFINTLPFWIGALLSIIFDFNRIKVAMVSMCLLFLCYVMYVGGDVFGYDRLTSPTLPLLLILFIDGVCRLFRTQSEPYFSRDKTQERVRAAFTGWGTGGLCFIAFCVAAIFSFGADLNVLAGRRYPEQATWTRKWTNYGVALNTILTPDATIGVFWAGTIPYYTAFKAVDFLGKCDRRIACLPPHLEGALKILVGHNKFDLKYSIIQLKPTYIQLTSWQSDKFPEWMERNYVAVKFLDDPPLVLNTDSFFLLRNSPRVRWDKINMDFSTFSVQKSISPAQR
jgi:hypothetical protein